MSVILNPARRRAERFADLVDRPGATATDRELDAALSVVTAMRSVVETAPAPRADFVADLRSRLMAEADTALVPTDQRLVLPDRSTSGRRHSRVAAAVAAAAIVAGSAGVAVAAQSSLPGESLYSLKRGIENTHEALSFSNAAQGKALLGQASARLGEARSLSKQGSTDEASATLNSFVASAGSGADLLFRDYQAHSDVDAVTAVRDFAGTSMGDLDALSADAPASLRPSLVAAAQLLADLDQQARVLCADCGARSPLSAPSDLALTSAPSLDQLLVDPSDATAVVSAPAPAKPGKAKPGATPVQVPDVAGTLDGAAGSPTTTGGGSGSGGSTPSKTPVAVPSAPVASAVTTVTDAVGQVVAGTVGAVTSTVAGLTALTGLTPKP